MREDIENFKQGLKHIVREANDPELLMENPSMFLYVQNMLKRKSSGIISILYRTRFFYFIQ